MQTPDADGGRADPALHKSEVTTAGSHNAVLVCENVEVGKDMHETWMPRVSFTGADPDPCACPDTCALSWPHADPGNPKSVFDVTAELHPLL